MPKFDFGELRKKASAAAEKIAEKSLELAKTTAEKTKQLSAIARLNAEVLAEKDNIKRAQLQIGKLYYELFRERPAEELADLCIKIDAANEAIAAKQEQIKQLKAELAAGGLQAPDVGAFAAAAGEAAAVKTEVEAAEAAGPAVSADPSPDDPPEAGDTPEAPQ